MHSRFLKIIPGTTATKFSRRGNSAAFTLVEVVLALGIASVALTAIVAIMSVSLSSSRESSDDTALALMSVAAINDLRRQPFSEIPGTTNVSAGVPVAATYPIFFDSTGLPITKATGEYILESDLPSYPTAIYRCDLTITADPETLSPVIGNPSLQSVNLVRIMFTFRWPLKATTANSRIIHASIARY